MLWSSININGMVMMIKKKVDDLRVVFSLWYGSLPTPTPTPTPTYTYTYTYARRSVPSGLRGHGGDDGRNEKCDEQGQEHESHDQGSPEIVEGSVALVREQAVAHGELTGAVDDHADR